MSNDVMDLHVLVVPGRTVQSWPGPKAKREEHGPEAMDGAAILEMPLGEALERRFTHEAFFVARAPTWPVDAGSGAKQRRLSLDVFREPGWLERLGGSITIQLGFADIDPPVPDPPPGFIEQWLERISGPAVEKARAAYPGLGAYRTKRGFRLIWVRKEPFVLRSLAECEAYSRRVQAENAHWYRRFHLKVDDLHDFERLQRVPHDQRPGDSSPTELATWL
jgi:hypothetical protein